MFVAVASVRPDGFTLEPFYVCFIRSRVPRGGLWPRPVLCDGFFFFFLEVVGFGCISLFIRFNFFWPATCFSLLALSHSL